MELYYTVFQTAAGWISVVASDKGLIKCSLPQIDKKKALSLPELSEDKAVLSRHRFADLEKRFIEYFNGINISFPDKPDILVATPFQRAVWAATRLIPYGETRSYKWIAEKVGSPKATRAVGSALGKNPLPVIIPCHRVIGSNGNLTGFTGGLDVNIKLLELEGASTKQ
jgi:O-6-methylguanine DNA methyltransferase